MNPSNALSALTLLLKLSDDPELLATLGRIFATASKLAKQAGSVTKESFVEAITSLTDPQKAIDIAAAAIGAELDGLLVLGDVELVQLQLTTAWSQEQIKSIDFGGK